jgi:hypothetical protein
MDVVRSCYTSNMQFYQDTDAAEQVAWYFTDREDFPTYPTAFVSSNWDSTYDKTDGCPVGEMQDGHVWRNGSVPPDTPQGPKPCGTPDQWAGNIVLADRTYGCEGCGNTYSGCACSQGTVKRVPPYFARVVGCSCSVGSVLVERVRGCSCSLGSALTTGFAFGCACSLGTASVVQSASGCSCSLGESTVPTGCPCPFVGVLAHGVDIATLRGVDIVDWDTPDVDTGPFWNSVSPSVFEVFSAGYYLVQYHGFVQVPFTSGVEHVQAFLAVNGVQEALPFAEVQIPSILSNFQIDLIGFGYIQATLPGQRIQIILISSSGAANITVQNQLVVFTPIET